MFLRKKSPAGSTSAGDLLFDIPNNEHRIAVRVELLLNFFYGRCQWLIAFLYLFQHVFYGTRYCEVNHSI